MKSDFIVALTQLAAERNLPREIVLSAIEAALASAYRKDSIAAGQDISVTLDPGTGEVSVFALKTIVEELADPQQELLLEDALRIKPTAVVGDSIATDSIPHSAGRIAAQTAKQVVMQRLREAERELIFEEFADKEGEVFSVNIQRIEPKQVVVDLGRAEAILPISEQAPYERYRPGQKMRVLLQSVQRSSKGPELIVSRADRLLLKRLFEMEVPEIYNGAVEIVGIAREPGSRSKVGVRATQVGVDPVGSCVGLRGVRIQNIVNELQGEKIDVVEWSKDVNKFIANALSPSQVMHVVLDEDAESAVVVVPDRQLSLAIGREGQNARLAARLTGWKIDIRSNVEVDAAADEKAKVVEAIKGAATPAEIELERIGLPARALNVLVKAGVTTVGDVLELSKAELLSIKSFGEKSYGQLYGRLGELDLLPVEPEPEVEQVIPQVEEVAESEPVAELVEEPPAQPEEVVKAPVAEVVTTEPEPEQVAAEVVAEVVAPEDQPAEAAAEPEPAPIPELEVEEEKEPVPALDHSASLRDLPENIWSIRRAAPVEPGRIRFAEEIAGLRGGVTARRGRRSGDDRSSRKRRPKAGRRR